MIKYVPTMSESDVTPHGVVVITSDIRYDAVPPQADTEELSERHERLVMYHFTDHHTMRIFVAPKGQVVAGWVIGLMKG